MVQMSNNTTFDYMLTRPDMALTVDKFVELNWWGEKTLADLEGDDWCDVWDFQEKLRELSGKED
jgi:hypothetical protein